MQIPFLPCHTDHLGEVALEQLLGCLSCGRVKGIVSEAPSEVSINLEGLISRKRKYCESFVAGGKHSPLSNLWMCPMVLVALFGSRTTSKVSCGLIDVSADLGQSQDVACLVVAVCWLVWDGVIFLHAVSLCLVGQPRLSW